ncbi:MAG: hypothetical protein EBS97_06020 [Verrucomicrobia bacterium]|nr:hypothetical protein [Verrucomicrobiota bacterium]
MSGTGNTTVIGAISNKTTISTNSSNLGTTNNGALVVNSGILNIATISPDNTNWVSGLVISNSAGVYVLGQLSLGSQLFGVKVGGTNATNRSIFGLMNTSSITSINLTNNFVIANSAAATNVFKAQTGKTLTLSGTISGSANGTRCGYLGVERCQYGIESSPAGHQQRNARCIQQQCLGFE